MKTDCFEFISENTRLSAILWLPEGQPKAILQIAHGMTEHMGRYEAFATALTMRGIAVCGYDLRGHGKNGKDKEIASFGEGGWQLSLQDMENFRREMKTRLGDAPYFMMGFSLGSFLLRDYLGIYPNTIDGALIIGTGDQPSMVLSMIKAVVKGEWKKAGCDGTTPLVKQLSFETYNQKFKPCQTESDWLCADEQELAAYINDPLCRKHISAGLFWQLLDSMQRTGNKKSLAAWKKDLPVLLLSGEQDPVGSNGKGVRAVYRQLTKAGMTDVTMELFPDARHDLFHERASQGAEKATATVLSWVEQHLLAERS